ncbi:unnamed protein product [Prorocentrum cordatum]|uniref:Uncharacterized protein n=1 Tax=Prorocentrum cordatum TaxID=2364126 RepID=A0ABN9XPV0_9DINO|nr:unnamed protein product [Polarella glacialis]
MGIAPRRRCAATCPRRRDGALRPDLLWRRLRGPGGGGARRRKEKEEEEERRAAPPGSESRPERPDTVEGHAKHSAATVHGKFVRRRRAAVLLVFLLLTSSIHIRTLQIGPARLEELPHPHPQAITERARSVLATWHP